MIELQLEVLKKELASIKQRAELAHTKLMIFQERDEFAAQIYYEKLLQLNKEYLDLDDQIQRLTNEVPPSHEHLFI